MLLIPFDRNPQSRPPHAGRLELLRLLRPRLLALVFGVLDLVPLVLGTGLARVDADGQRCQVESGPEF